ncbi:MAG: hypothetical protein ACO1OB_17080 [Archangium sp.]
MAVIRMLDARNLPKLEVLDVHFDPTRLTHAKLDFLYAALLRFAEVAPLKKFSLPYDDRRSHPLRDRMSRRLSENSSP